MCPGYCPIKSLRLDGPLRSLLGQGLISAYTIISPRGHSMGSNAEPGYFDCIWLQRELFYSDWFGYHILGRLPFLLDWDDLLGKCRRIPALQTVLLRRDSSRSLRNALNIARS